MSRRQQCALTVVLAFLLSVSAFGPASAFAAEATMTFTGAVNVVGLLSSITVQPGAVTIPAGGEAAFVNSTSAALTVTVGGKSARLEPGGSATMLFTGAERAETFDASAISANLPVIGALTSSVGRVTVLAIPASSVRSTPADPPAAPRGSSAPRSSATPASAGPASSAGPGGTNPARPGDAVGTEPETRSGSVVPLDPDSSVSPRPDDAAKSASAGAPGSSGSTGRPDEPGSEGADGGQSDEGAADGGRAAPAARSVDAEVEPVLPPFPGFSSTHDQLGLVFLLGAVVLAGLGAALFRTVLAYRPIVEVGAHSQAARKARKVRRRRG